MGSVTREFTPALSRLVTAANRITYSPALTIVPTYECFNRCHYCNFRKHPNEDEWLPLAEVEQRLLKAKSQGMIEVLVLSGEVHPHSDRRAAWLQHIYAICDLALGMGLLPHTNAGPLNLAEMAQLKQVNVSMGLMLEQITPTLLKGVHRHAPSKVPEVRLRQLEQAGELRIPFTTGLLLGIGESPTDRIDTLKAIAACHERWGHIQEVILQPHQTGTSQAEIGTCFPANQLADFVATARSHLPSEITIQIPPNLMTSQSYILQAIANGARDLGGLGPVDEVNPDYPHPTADDLKRLLEPEGWQLQPRLPIYPQYDAWLPSRLQQLVDPYRQPQM
ncbi:MAG: 7,8-didemethyl-8-hydroxy-5-deazariboflavin synthase subunit CofG [Leptolyngbyaceae cyanobacterium]